MIKALIIIALVVVMLFMGIKRWSQQQIKKNPNVVTNSPPVLPAVLNPLQLQLMKQQIEEVEKNIDPHLRVAVDKPNVNDLIHRGRTRDNLHS